MVASRKRKSRQVGGFRSGLWDSNPRLRPWEGRALPTELSPRGSAPSQRFRDARKRSRRSPLAPGSAPFLRCGRGIVAGGGGTRWSLCVGSGGARSCTSLPVSRPKVGPIGPAMCRKGAPARAVTRGVELTDERARIMMCPPWTCVRVATAAALGPRGRGKSLCRRCHGARNHGEVCGPRSGANEKIAEIPTLRPFWGDTGWAWESLGEARPPHHETSTGCENAVCPVFWCCWS